MRSHALNAAANSDRKSAVHAVGFVLNAELGESFEQIRVGSLSERVFVMSGVEANLALAQCSNGQQQSQNCSGVLRINSIAWCSRTSTEAKDFETLNRRGIREREVNFASSRV